MSQKEPKSKKKGPKRVLNELKKPLISGSIIASIAIAGIIGGIYLINLDKRKGGTFIMGYGGGLEVIDPVIVYFYDPIAFVQIAEPLFNEKVNQTTDYHENVPHLALEGVWSDDLLNFTCTLREGIRFHDGTQFNASAVKWNFDRLQNFSHPFLTYLWYHPDGTLILNRTEVIDDYIVRFVLNKPYVPFRSLLTHPQAYIISPTSTPKNRYLNASTEKVVGTGPYIFKSNIVYVNTTLEKNENYWGRPKPVIDKLVFLSVNYIESNEIFFAEETDYAVGNDSYWEAYMNDTTIVVDDFVEKGFDYLGMNNQRINTTMRKAISYALNYSAILELHDFHSHGSQIRCQSPLPLGTLYSNWGDFDVPYYNISIARQVLKDANWPGTESLIVNDNITTGNEWETLANGPTPLGIYNISYVLGKEETFRGELPGIVLECLKQIGVKVDVLGLTSPDNFNNIFTSNIDLFWVGWIIDFNDPANTINAVFSSKIDGESNYQQTNDSIVQEWMEEGLVETNLVQRAHLYYNIQKRLIEEVFPVALLYSCVWYDVYRSNLRGWGDWGAGAFKNMFFV
ncbi:MAG: ABC transporter substrate-binding protein [Promethearchaeota archaeon]